MLEIHPFGSFVPKNAKYLILGSFTGKKEDENFNLDWYYGTKRNQFWNILRSVYNLPLENRDQKIELFQKLGIAISDIIYSCERKNGTNLDNNLIKITYNLKEIEGLLSNLNIQRIYCTSKFVEKKFLKEFKNIIIKYHKIQIITLPSPSPRYSHMSLKDKAEIYKKLLPLPNTKVSQP